MISMRGITRTKGRLQKLLEGSTLPSSKGDLRESIPPQARTLLRALHPATWILIGLRIRKSSIWLSRALARWIISLGRCSS